MFDLDFDKLSNVESDNVRLFDSLESLEVTFMKCFNRERSFFVATSRGIVSKFACRVTTTFLLVRCYQKSIIHMRTIMVRFFKNGSSRFHLFSSFHTNNFYNNTSPAWKKLKNARNSLSVRQQFKSPWSPTVYRSFAQYGIGPVERLGTYHGKNNFTTNKWEKCLKVFGAEIRTHDVYNMSFLP